MINAPRPALPRPARRPLSALALSALLTGCAAISAVNDATRPLDVYELRAPEGIAATTRRPLARDVIVELPTSSGSLATDRIMIRPDALQAQYLPDIRWADPAPVMVQTLMLRSLEATGALRYVGRKPLGSSGDYALVTEIVDFQAELDPQTDGQAETATVRLTLIVRAVRERDARIVASRRLQAGAQAASTETAAILAAFDTASDALLSEFATWLPGALPR